MDINHPTRRRRAGLTLVELLTTLATSSVILVLSVAYYRTIVQTSAVSVAAHNLYSHLSLARGEAVDRGERVIMCPSHDGSGCTGGFDWGAGWILFVDHDADRERDPADPLLRLAARSDPSITIRTSEGRPRVIYQPDGTVTGGSNTHFRICVEPASDRNRAVVVSLVGRPRISSRSPDGNTVTCPQSG